MSALPKFDPKELKVVREIPPFWPGGPSTPIYDFPVTPKEAYEAVVKRQPIWQPLGLETKMFAPLIYPDNVVRALVVEAEQLPREKFGGKDMFGIEWVYVDQAGGSIVKPGEPLLKNANDWKDVIKWPDIDAWDWAGSAKRNEAFLNDGTFPQFWQQTGFFERLISFMDFQYAAVALVDEDQQDAVKEIMFALADLYINVIDHVIDYYHIKGFYIHDDWGSQMAPFFSPAIGAELIVPAMRKVTDHIHSRGGLAEFHSCGKNELQVPNMIAAGWDAWQGQEMNDNNLMYEKYGDKILIGVAPEPIDPTATEEAQRAQARKFAEKYCNPKKPALIGFGFAFTMTPAYREELYKQSRIKFCG